MFNQSLSENENHRDYLTDLQDRHRVTVSPRFALEAIRFAVERDVSAPKWAIRAVASVVNQIQRVLDEDERAKSRSREVVEALRFDAHRFVEARPYLSAELIASLLGRFQDEAEYLTDERPSPEKPARNAACSSMMAVVPTLTLTPEPCDT